MKKDLFSVGDEPALRHGGGFEPDPAERKAVPARPLRDRYEELRDSVFNEPFQPDNARTFRAELDRRSARLSGPLRFRITAAAGILGGIAAVPCVFLAGTPGWGGVVYLTLFGPAAEELLKQLGMLYLLEKRPYTVSRRWQFPLAAFFGGLLFATVENLVYAHIYLARLPAAELGRIMAFRWTICTALHVGCTLISGLGLERAWRESRQAGTPFNLQPACLYFAAAITLHGLYNLASLFFF